MKTHLMVNGPSMLQPQHYTNARNSPQVNITQGSWGYMTTKPQTALWRVWLTQNLSAVMHPTHRLAKAPPLPTSSLAQPLKSSNPTLLKTRCGYFHEQWCAPPRLRMSKPWISPHQIHQRIIQHLRYLNRQLQHLPSWAQQSKIHHSQPASQQAGGVKRHNIPTWTAYNSLLSSAKPLTEVGALPLIASPAHEWQTLMMMRKMEILPVNHEHQKCPLLTNPNDF